MASGFSLGITIGASVGGAVAGIKSVKSSLDVLDKTVKGLAARQSLLGETLLQIRANRFVTQPQSAEDYRPAH